MRSNRIPVRHVLIVSLAVLAVAALAAMAATTASAPATGHESMRFSPNFQEFQHFDGRLTLKITIILVQVAVVLVAAKLLGALAEKFRVPGVLGELAAGVIVGPFAFGGLIPIPIHHVWVPLFPAPLGLEWPISDEFWLIAQLASIILLFMAGLHTNLKQFLSYLGPASIVAVGGVVVPFFFGAFATAWFSTHVWHQPVAWHTPQALFMGAIMVATSVGITARVLSDIKKLDTPEGVTILGAAVVDDVLGILVLAIVGATAKAQTSGGGVQLAGIAYIAVKAIGFWLGLTFVGMALADRIERLFSRVRYAGARLGLALALALICSGIAEMFGLAFIIGAYSIGLALSKTKMAHQLIEDLTPINDFLVPIFFAAMGMLVNFKSMSHALGFGLLICVLAIIGKVVGCGLPSLFTGFNLRGAYRIGIGMLPRGEVALILAGVGLANNYVDQSTFGVAILMTLLTTVIAPLFLVPAFNAPGSGVRREEPRPAPEPEPVTFTAAMSPGLCRLFTQVLLAVADEGGYRINLDEAEQGIYLLQKGDRFLSVTIDGGNITAHTTSTHKDELDALIQKVEDRIVQAVGDIRPDVP